MKLSTYRSVLDWASAAGRKNVLVRTAMYMANCVKATVKHEIDRKEIYEMADQFAQWPLSGKDRRRIFRGARHAYLWDFLPLDNYFFFNFDGKTRAERKTYYTDSLYCYHYYAYRMSDQEQARIIDTKSLFAEAAGELYGRDFLLYDKETPYDDYLQFVSRHKTFLVKSTHGFAGHGIRKVELHSDEDVQALWEGLKNQYYFDDLKDDKNFKFARLAEDFDTAILDESIASDPELAAFHPQSLNTFRVFTVNNNGSAVPLCSYFRIGVGDSFMDHMSNGAISAAVDIQSGVIISPGKDPFMKDFLFHPDTGKQIIGFKVPDWEGCLEMVKRLTKLFPKVPIIGWDMVRTADGRWIPVEGNSTPGTPNFQFQMRQGILPEVEKALQ